MYIITGVEDASIMPAIEFILIKYYSVQTFMSSEKMSTKITSKENAHRSDVDVK